MARAESQRQNRANEQRDRQMTLSIGSLLRLTFEKWYGDNIPRHAAALAFYTLFAIAPLLLLSVELMGVLYGRETAEAQLTAQVEQYVHSADAAALVQTVLDNALPSSANWIVTVGIVVALIYGASAVFFELQVMLNIIWGVHLEDGGDFWQIVWDRILAIVMVMFSGLLIVGGLVLTLWYSAASSWAINQQLATNSNVNQISYFLLLFAITALVFALIYKYVPAIHTAWHDVIIGAVSTAFLVSIARLVITLYLSYNRIGSVYGAAGSLVILLLWVYYSAQIFFLGAEFTHVYSRTYGARRRGQAPGMQKALTRRRSNPLRRLNGRQEAVDTGKDATTPPTEQPAEQPTPLVVKAGERSAPNVEIEIINLNERHEPTTDSSGSAATESTAEQGEESEQTTWRRWFRLPRFLWPDRSERESQTETQPEPSVPTPELPTVPIKEEPSGTRQRLKQLVAVPLQVIRPFREIITAVSVIGALSVAVLFGFPWRRRKRQALNQNDSSQVEDPATESDADNESRITNHHLSNHQTANRQEPNHGPTGYHHHPPHQN